MKFALATLYVSDMEQSLAFYNGLLALPITGRMPGPGGELVFLGEEDKPGLELIPSAGPVAHAGFSIGFEAEDLPAAKQKLAAHGYVVKRELSPPGSGMTLCFIEGPDGEEVELIGKA